MHQSRYQPSNAFLGSRLCGSRSWNSSRRLQYSLCVPSFFFISNHSQSSADPVAGTPTSFSPTSFSPTTFSDPAAGTTSLNPGANSSSSSFRSAGMSSLAESAVETDSLGRPTLVINAGSAGNAAAAANTVHAAATSATATGGGGRTGVGLWVLGGVAGLAMAVV